MLHACTWQPMQGSNGRAVHAYRLAAAPPGLQGLPMQTAAALGVLLLLLLSRYGRASSKSRGPTSTAGLPPVRFTFSAHSCSMPPGHA